MEISEKLFINHCLNKRAYAVQYLNSMNLPSGTSSEMHFHDCFECMLIASGDINFQTENFTLPLKQRSLIVFEPNLLHRPVLNNQDLPYFRYTLHIKQSMLDSLSTMSSNLIDVFHKSRTIQHKILSPVELQQLATRFEHVLNLITSPEEFGKDVLIRAALSELLIMVCRLFLMENTANLGLISSYSKLTTNIFKYIDANIHEKITLESLSKCIHVNKYYMSHVFKQETGMTIYQFVTQKRVIFAQKLLISGECPSDVCFLCGFNDYSNFYRAFLSEYGIAPKEYKRIHQIGEYGPTATP